MVNIHSPILTKIEEFLKETGMSASYFGKVAAGQSELVARLRKKGDVTTRTHQRLEAFMTSRRKDILNKGYNIDRKEVKELKVEGENTLGDGGEVLASSQGAA